MTFYSEMADTALDLIQEFGQTGTISRTTGDTFNSVAGTVSGGTITNYSCSCAIFNFTGEDNKTGWLVQQGDKKILVAASCLSITPNKLSDKITVNSKTYSIENFKEVNPAGTPVLFVVQGRV